MLVIEVFKLIMKPSNLEDNFFFLNPVSHYGEINNKKNFYLVLVALA